MKGLGKIINSGISSLGKAELLGMGLNAYFTYGDYKSAKEEGKGDLGAIASAVGTNVAMDVIGLPSYMAYKAATALPSALIGGYEKIAMESRRMSQMSGNIPFRNATFVDTPQIYTMRQAGMQMAKASKYNLQQAQLGNEASFL